MSDDMGPDLRDLVAGWLGHELPPERRDELLARLEADPVLRKALAAEITTMSDVLAVQEAEPRWWHLLEELGLAGPDPTPRDPAEPGPELLDLLLQHEPVECRPPRSRLAWHAPLVGVAAGLLAAVLVGAWLSRDRDTASRDPVSPSSAAGRPAAVEPDSVSMVLVQAADVEWEPGAAIPADGGRVRPGRIAFRSGTVMLASVTGVTLTVEGPADLEILADNRVFLHRGRLRSKVSSRMLSQMAEQVWQMTEHAILLPGAAVANLGEEFGAAIDPDGRCHMAALKGATGVEICPVGDQARLTHVLKPGTAISIAPPDYAIVPESPDPARFPSPLEPDLSLPVAAGYPALVRAAGPWGYWRFEVTDGGRIPNEIPGRPALKVNGPIDVAGGRAGFRLSTGDQVLISEGTWSPPRDPGFAIEFWVLSNEVNNEAMASLIPDTPPGKVVLHHALVELRRPQSLWRDHTDVGPEWVAPAGTLRFVYRDPPLDKGPASLLTDRVCVPYRWHHVVAQKTGDRLEVYLDGRLAASGEPPVPPAGPPPDCRLVLGQLKTVSQKEWHQTRKFVGLMDEVAVYERPLSRDEIRTHSAGGR